MKDTLRSYMNELLVDVPKTHKVLELKEELISNMQERYEDLVAEGFQTEDAYQSVVESMGDVKALFSEFVEDKKEVKVVVESEEIRRKRAWISTVAVGFYIFAGAFAILLSTLDDMHYLTDGDTFAPIAFLILAIIPTCMLVYKSHMYPHNKKETHTVVEEFKEWQSESQREKQTKRAISAIIWLGATAIFFIISFETYQWQITWITFLIAGCIQAVVEIFYNGKKS